MTTHALLKYQVVRSMLYTSMVQQWAGISLFSTSNGIEWMSLGMLMMEAYFAIALVNLLSLRERQL